MVVILSGRFAGKKAVVLRLVPPLHSLAVVDRQQTKRLLSIFAAMRPHIRWAVTLIFQCLHL